MVGRFSATVRFNDVVFYFSCRLRAAAWQPGVYCSRVRQCDCVHNPSVRGSRGLNGGDEDYTIDELKDCHARLGHGLEAGAVEQLAFKRGETGFAQGLVETVAHRTHRWLHTSFFAALAEGERGATGCSGRRNSDPHMFRAEAEAYQTRVEALDRREALHQPKH